MWWRKLSLTFSGPYRNAPANRLEVRNIMKNKVNYCGGCQQDEIAAITDLIFSRIYILLMQFAKNFVKLETDILLFFFFR